MLVLTRKVGQQIVIGHDIAITVIEVDGERVRLGIEAPETVRVLRGELLQEVAAANGAAVSPQEQLLARLLRHLVATAPHDPRAPDPAESP